jgi:hypothetical protein
VHDNGAAVEGLVGPHVGPIETIDMPISSWVRPFLFSKGFLHVYVKIKLFSLFYYLIDI